MHSCTLTNSSFLSNYAHELVTEDLPSVTIHPAIALSFSVDIWAEQSDRSIAHLVHNFRDQFVLDYRDALIIGSASGPFSNRVWNAAGV
jgi:hypothetical protein